LYLAVVEAARSWWSGWRSESLLLDRVAAFENLVEREGGVVVIVIFFVVG
jgi:hypothetical protein